MMDCVFSDSLLVVFLTALLCCVFSGANKLSLSLSLSLSHSLSLSLACRRRNLEKSFIFGKQLRLKTIRVYTQHS